MDPVANLEEQRTLAEQIIEIIDESAADIDSLGHEALNVVAHKAERLAELVQALDEWMKKGGFSPWPTK